MHNWEWTDIAFIAYAALYFLLRFLLNTPRKPTTVHDSAYAINALIQSEYCVITGEKATEHHTITFTQSSVLIFFILWPTTITLPFSQKGWSIYKKESPWSVRILNAPTRIIGIPILMLFDFLWFATYGLVVFPVLAVIDLIYGRRQLITMPLLTRTDNVRLRITERYHSYARSILAEDRYSSPNNTEHLYTEEAQTEDNMPEDGKHTTNGTNNEINLNTIQELASYMSAEGAEKLTSLKQNNQRLTSFEINSFIKQLEHEDWHIRSDAADSLGNYTGTAVVEALLSALRDIDWHVRCSAADSLGRIMDLRAINPLISAVEDTNRNVSCSALDALKRIRSSYHTSL